MGWSRFACTFGLLLALSGAAVAQAPSDREATAVTAFGPTLPDVAKEEYVPLDAPCSGMVDINGSGTTSWGFLFNSFWHDRRCTSIYLASEFGCDGGTIVQMSYYVISTPGQVLNNLTIRLRPTTAASYTTPYCFDNTGWTVVYQANESIGTTGWYTFTLTTPFAWSAPDNLEVDVSFNNSSYTTSTGNVYGFTAAATRTKYAYCDSCNGDPLLWTCGSPNPTVNGSTTVPRVQFVFGAPVPTGACCFPNGSCQVTTETNCGSLGGNYLGDGTTCTPNPCPQPNVRCCLPDGSCLFITAAECQALGGVPGTYGTNCDPVPSYAPTLCGNGFEDISTYPGAVQLTLPDDNGVSVPIGFTFTYYGSAKTTVAVCSNGYLTFAATGWTVYVDTPIPNTGLPNDMIAPLWDDFNPAAGGTVHYVTDGSPGNRRFIAQWLNVPQYGTTDQNTFQVILYEADGCIEFRYGAFATLDYTAGVENADGTRGVDVTGMVSQYGCILLCPSFDPPCPQPGACCFLNGTCLYTLQSLCAAMSGCFLGVGTSCDPNPCPVVCYNGIPEGEPICYDGYTDVYNGGCNSTPPVFTAIACGDTVCGTAGTFLVGTTQTRDTDWYEVVTLQPTIFTWTVTTTFPGLIGLVEQITPGVPGCSNITGYINPYAFSTACSTASVTTACLPAGTYYFFVATSAFTGTPCGAEYVATLTCVPCGPGACCVGPNCVPDLTEADCALQGGVWQGAGTDCFPNPCRPIDYYWDSGSGEMGGNGWNGEWIYYPNSPSGPWWNMWWPNEYDLYRQKVITITFWTEFAPGGWIEIAVNWSTPPWQNPNRPPLANEEPFIERAFAGVYTVPGQWDFTIVLPYCPAWVSVDVRGQNFRIEGVIEHICLPGVTGACCFPGYVCQVLTQGDCLAQGGRYIGDGVPCGNPLVTCGCKGDCNCDGVIDFGDINPFVAALTNPGSACNPWNCDINDDGFIDFDDINGFVALLSTGAVCP